VFGSRRNEAPFFADDLRMTRAIRPTGIENILGEEELIVSKTDLKGRITYANDVFIRMAKYSWKELVGAPHSLVRHPQMPRCVFKLLWDTLQAKQEIFAYVVNLAKDGSHYWVFAHVTPTLDDDGNIVGYHSNRRKPDRPAIFSALTVIASPCRALSGAPEYAKYHPSEYQVSSHPRPGRPSSLKPTPSGSTWSKGSGFRRKTAGANSASSTD
jgi:PAS domain S-box-containing protein